MHATFFGVTATLLMALCQTATDIATKVATREAEERLALAAQWTVGALLLSLIVSGGTLPYFSQPTATVARAHPPRQ
jgi:hypothetical protein